MPFRPSSPQPDPRAETMRELRELLPPHMADELIEAARREYDEDRRRPAGQTAQRMATKTAVTGQRHVRGSRFLERRSRDA